MSTPSAPATAPLHKNENLKAESNFLRGNILRDLADHSTGGITEESAQLTKFHGIYAQDDRDQRNARRREGREKAFSFMARVRLPGGVCTPAQWLALDTLADERANGTLKLTTRQAFQFHGILKGDLWRAINGMNRSLLDTLAACGDVNRNVMCNPNPEQSGLHADVYRIANAISEHLLPRSRAYHELWVGDELVGGGHLLAHSDASSAPATRNIAASPSAGASTCTPTGRPCAPVPYGTLIAAWPARFVGMVNTSQRYMVSGSLVLSPILNATVGDVGVRMASQLAYAAAKSSAISRRSFWACR